MAESSSLARALEDAQAGRLDAALTAVRLHLRRSPQDGEAVGILGLLLVRSGEVEQATDLPPPPGGMAPHRVLDLATAPC